MKKVTVNNNKKIHYAVAAGNHFDTICGCEQMSGRMRLPRYHVAKDNTEVTCQRCAVIMAARLGTER